MKFLVENYGESEELNIFVSQIERRFPKYYEVELMLGDTSKSRRYFAYEEAAREYYDGLLKETQDNSYYDNASITLSEVNITRDYNELESSGVTSDTDLEIFDDQTDINED